MDIEFEAAHDLIKNINHMRRIAGEPELDENFVNMQEIGDDMWLGDGDNPEFLKLINEEKRLIKIMKATHAERHKNDTPTQRRKNAKKRGNWCP